eukprot:364009-Chlamydomonas_euryale.AAC.12
MGALNPRHPSSEAIYAGAPRAGVPGLCVTQPCGRHRDGRLPPHDQQLPGAAGGDSADDCQHGRRRRRRRQRGPRPRLWRGASRVEHAAARGRARRPGRRPAHAPRAATPRLIAVDGSDSWVPSQRAQPIAVGVGCSAPESPPPREPANCPTGADSLDWDTAGAQPAPGLVPKAGSDCCARATCGGAVRGPGGRRGQLLSAHETCDA